MVGFIQFVISIMDKCWLVSNIRSVVASKDYFSIILEPGLEPFRKPVGNALKR